MSKNIKLGLPWGDKLDYQIDQEITLFKLFGELMKQHSVQMRKHNCTSGSYKSIPLNNFEPLYNQVAEGGTIIVNSGLSKVNNSNLVIEQSLSLTQQNIVNLNNQQQNNPNPNTMLQNPNLMARDRQPNYPINPQNQPIDGPKESSNSNSCTLSRLKDYTVCKEITQKDPSAIYEDLKLFCEYLWVATEGCGIKTEDIDASNLRKDDLVEPNGVRGGEDYYPPNGLFGIGLKPKSVNGDISWVKDNNKYCTCYHGVGFGREDALKIVGYIYNDKFHVGEGQPFENYLDKNHKGKYVGIGVYLNKNIQIALERASDKSYYKGYRYAPVLMCKVKRDDLRISEEENPGENAWVADPDKIMITQVLFKKLGK